MTTEEQLIQEEAEETGLKMYAVRNKDGLWFRRKGYGGYGESWVPDLDSARIYTKPGGARSQITWWGKKYPEYGVPRLVVFSVAGVQIIDETARVLGKKKAEEERQARLKVERHQREVEEAQRDLERAKRKLAELEK